MAHQESDDASLAFNLVKIIPLPFEVICDRFTNGTLADIDLLGDSYRPLITANYDVLFKLACMNPNVEVIKSYYKPKCNIDLNICLVRACSADMVENAKFLIEYGADPCFDDCWAFRFACANGALKCSKLLFEISKCDINAFNEYAMVHAILNNHKNIFDWLISLPETKFNHELIYSQVIYHGHMFINMNMDMKYMTDYFKKIKTIAKTKRRYVRKKFSLQKRSQRITKTVDRLILLD